MNRQSCVNTVAICGTILAAAAIVGRAGPLDPPAGPVASSHKTLTEVEPRTPVGATTTPGDATAQHVISTSGSYYLTEHIVGVSGKDGIRIDASDVALDLNGFTLRGLEFPPGSGTLLSDDGIQIPGGVESAVVRNGVITNWGESGIEAINARGCRYEDLMVTGNTEQGIFGGLHPIMRGCTLVSNGMTGFTGQSGAVVEGCTAQGNDTGYTISGGLIRSSVAQGNTGVGFDLQVAAAVGCVARQNGDKGFEGSSSTIIRHCLAVANRNDGIEVTGANLVTQCLASGNGVFDAVGAGIRSVQPSAGISGNRIEGNTVHGNDYGVASAGDAFIVSNVATGNTTDFLVLPTDNVGQIQIQTGGSTITTGNGWANWRN